MPLCVGVPLTVITFADQDADTPVGNPVAVPIPVAPVVALVIVVNAVLIQSVLLFPPEAFATVLAFTTVIVPTACSVTQPPVKSIVYTYVPTVVGVPLIVKTLDAQLAVTPGGNPATVPLPVEPVVACVTAVIATFLQTVGVLEAELTVLPLTLIVPVAFTGPHAPINGME